MKNKKTILVDLDRLKNPFSGLGQFALHIGKYLSMQIYEDMEFTFLVPPRYQGYFGNNVHYEITDWKRRYFPQFLKSYDLWHAIHQDSNFYPNFSKTKYLLTIHDLNFLQEKSTYKAQKRLKRLQKKVDQSIYITTISHYSKNQIEKHLKISVPIEVIYNGIEISEQEQPIFNLSLENKKVLLGIGVIQPKKNWHILIEMLNFLPDEYVLMLAGDKSTDYAKYIQKHSLKLELNDRVKMIGTVTEEEKSYLLKRCEAFVYPSKYEGMGMPPIEAMLFGKPVFVFPNSSIPEFCKQFAYYWNIEEPQHMAKFLLQILQKHYNNQDFIASQIDYAKQFGWKKNVENYLSLYRKILNND